MTTAAAGGSGGFGGAGWVSGGYTSAQVDGAGGFGSESGDDGDNPFASGTYGVCGSGGTPIFALLTRTAAAPGETVSVSESSEGSVGGNKPG